MIKYPYTFSEMLDKIFSNDPGSKSFQGEDFADGVFVQLRDNTIVVFDYNGLFPKRIWNLPITRGILNMRFREVFTRDDILRKEDFDGSNGAA